jgi:ATP-dependent Clp protease ATP-binding subunit ClpA
MERNGIGFTLDDRSDRQDSAVKEYFRPEFRNRLDVVCKFSQLGKPDLEKVVFKFIDELNIKLKEKNISITAKPALIDHIVKESSAQKMGARPVRRLINQIISIPLSKKILFENINPGLYSADWVEDKIVFSAETVIEKFPEITQDGLVIV